KRQFGGFPALYRVSADPDLADQPRMLEKAHVVHDGPVVAERVGVVHLVQVQPGHTQAASTRLSPLPHQRASRCKGKELSCDADRLAVIAERPAKDPLTAAACINFRGIKQRDTELNRPPDNGDSRTLRVRLSVTPLPGAELPGT